jgi:hypothetical protein
VANPPAVQVGDEIGVFICAPVVSSDEVIVVLGMVAVMGVVAGVAPVASTSNSTVPETVALPLAVAIDTRDPAIVKSKAKLSRLTLAPVSTGLGVAVPVTWLVKLAVLITGTPVQVTV